MKRFFIGLLALSGVCGQVSAGPLKVWNINPTVWNGVTQTPTCPANGSLWDTPGAGFPNPEGAPIGIKKISIFFAGAGGLQGDYAYTIWIFPPVGDSTAVFRDGFEIYAPPTDTPQRVLEFAPDYVPMAANEALQLRFECGWFSSIAPPAQQGHLFFPFIRIEYVIPPN